VRYVNNQLNDWFNSPSHELRIKGENNISVLAEAVLKRRGGQSGKADSTGKVPRKESWIGAIQRIIHERGGPANTNQIPLNAIPWFGFEPGESLHSINDDSVYKQIFEWLEQFPYEW
jgi:hypothetical protein